MYLNFGEKNIIEYGRLIKQITKHTYDVIAIEKKDNDYLVYECFVDLKDPMIDEDDIYAYGCIEEYLPMDFAIACVDYYGPEAFCNRKHQYSYNKDELKEYLSKIECEDKITVE